MAGPHAGQGADQFCDAALGPGITPTLAKHGHAAHLRCLNRLHYRLCTASRWVRWLAALLRVSSLVFSVRVSAA